MSMDQSDERQTDLAVMDVNEIKQKRRLMRILDSREKVEKKANEARELYVTGQVSQKGRDLLVLYAVREYIRECWNLLRDHTKSLDDDEPAYYLSECHLGTLDFPNSDRESIAFNGLYDYLHCSIEYEETWEETLEWRHGQDQTQVHSETHTVPLEVTWRAYLKMSEFLSEVHDLEMQFESLDRSVGSFGFESIDMREMDIETIDELEDAIETEVDARAVTDGGDDE